MHEVLFGKVKGENGKMRGGWWVVLQALGADLGLARFGG